MQRSALLLQTEGSRTDVHGVLVASGWQARRVVDQQDLPCAISSSSCAVGVVVFDDPQQYRLDTLPSLLNRADMEWIAVTTRDAPRDPCLARLLASSFFDFHTLPLDRSRLSFSLGHALGKAMLRRSAPQRTISGTGRFGMVGTSAPMLELYHALDKIVRVDAPVLICGESGTGKELAALAIHAESVRRSGPFVPVNCGAIPPTLIPSALFGAEKGSFTGAHQLQVGSIESASGGTIFLDEIGDLPLESQASLLRFLQESTIVRIGSNRPIRVDARIIAATHVDLAEANRAGLFRQDLYYRLNVLHVEIPPLRERLEDIPLLVDHIFETHRAQKAPEVRGFSPEAVAAMQAHTWPGNVRELINRVQKAMIMCERPLIMPADLGLTTQRLKSASVSLASARQLTEFDIVHSALERNDFNMAAAARELGISRVTLYRLVQRLGIQRKTMTHGPFAQQAASLWTARNAGMPDPVRGDMRQGDERGRRIKDGGE